MNTPQPLDLSKVTADQIYWDWLFGIPFVNGIMINPKTALEIMARAKVQAEIDRLQVEIIDPLLARGVQA